jgi:hypothetical protein
MYTRREFRSFQIYLQLSIFWRDAEKQLPSQGGALEIRKHLHVMEGQFLTLYMLRLNNSRVHLPFFCKGSKC